MEAMSWLQGEREQVIQKYHGTTVGRAGGMAAMVSIVPFQLLLACMPEDSGDKWALRRSAPGTEAVEGAPFSMHPAVLTTPSASCFHIFSPIIMAASMLPTSSQGSQMGQKK